MILGNKQKTITYGQAQEIIKELAEIRQELAAAKRGNGTAGGLLGAVVNTTNPRIDGHVTLADVFVSATIPVGFTGFGVALAAGAMLAGAPFDDAMELLGRSVQIGGCLGAIRLVGDALNLGRMWYGTIGIVLERIEEWRENREEERSSIRLIPYQGPELKIESLSRFDEPTGVANRLYELADDVTIRIRELWNFLEIAFETGDWTRSEWCGGDGKAGRGMTQPMWYALRDTLGPLGVWGTKDRPTLESFVEKTREP